MLSKGAPIRAILIILFIVSACGVAAAQDTSVRDSNYQACVDAQIAADDETSATEWFFSGCFSGLAIASNADVPEPPVSALVGKDKAYVDRYVECYQLEVRTVRRRWAMVGCCIGFPIQIFSNLR
ncbi:MAG: hypothetical protein ACKOE4_01870 [Candidatus Kapaibacterium sp.]